MSPVRLGVNLSWLILFSFSLCYLTLMPCMFLPELNLQDFTALYIAAAMAALPPLLSIMAGIWALYSYLYIVTVPIARPLGQGRLPAHLAVSIAGARFLRALIRLAYTWVLILGAFCREPALLLTASPLRSRIQEGSPHRVATGWCAGTHPHVLYA